MKRYFIVITLLLIFNVANSQIIVNVTNGDNLQQLIDNAESGTIFNIQQGSFGNIEVYKKVTLVGSGYDFTNSQNSTEVGYVNFNPGSDGSIITGFRATRFISANASNVSIKRNYVKSVNLVQITSENYNNEVTQNFIEDFVGLSCQNYSFCNNICLIANIISNTNYHGKILNNVFNLNGPINGFKGIRLGNFLNIIENNIFFKNVTVSSDAGYPIDIVNYPFFKYNTFGNFLIGTPDNTNTQILDINNVFVGYPTNSSNLSPDAAAQLTPNSIARNVGRSNTDCGAFNGLYSYILSGIPESIFHVNSKQSGSWNAPYTWNWHKIPTASDNVTINSNQQIQISVNESVSCKVIEIKTDAVLNIPIGSTVLINPN